MSSSGAPSTLQSYVDSATGTLQSALGALTGSTGDQKAGDAKQDKAAVEKDVSHAALKVGNVTAGSSGAISKDDPMRTEGSWNQTVGSGKEFVGGLVGSEVCRFYFSFLLSSLPLFILPSRFSFLLFPFVLFRFFVWLERKSAFLFVTEASSFGPSTLPSLHATLFLPPFPPPCPYHTIPYYNLYIDIH
jgi:uncharacterized protein YjbJ (UPF0337 family)